MEAQYTDKTGVKHDIRILTPFCNDELVFTIYQNGDPFCELVRDYDRWIELYSGPSDRAAEYGRLIDDLSVFVDRKFEKTLFDGRQAGI